MKLHFHGADYEHPDLHLKAQDHQLRGTYRGSPLIIHQHQVKYRHQTAGSEMSYRGVHYKHN